MEDELSEQEKDLLCLFQMKILKSSEDSGVITDGVTETVKREIKKTRRWISWSFVIKNGRGVRRSGR